MRYCVLGLSLRIDSQHDNIGSLGSADMAPMAKVAAVQRHPRAIRRQGHRSFRCIVTNVAVVKLI
jgi:hypothetical protein